MSMHEFPGYLADISAKTKTLLNGGNSYLWKEIRPGR